MERIEDVDVVKGIGILLVVLGHLPLPPLVHRVIYSFHMPLFIFASGMVFNIKSIVKVTKSLIIPYWIYGIFTTFIYYVLYKNESIKTQIIAVIMGGVAPDYCITPATALWFLMALLCIQCIYVCIYILKNKAKSHENTEKINKYILPLCTLLLTILGIKVSAYRNKVPMIYNIDIALAMFVFFVAGNKFNKKILKLKSGKIIMLLSFIILIFITTAGKNGDINFFRMALGKNIYICYVNAFLGILMTLFISNIIARNRYMKGIKTILILIGKNTLAIMCLHQVMLSIIIDMYKKAGGNASGYNFTLIVYFPIIAFCLLISMIIKKCKEIKK